MRAAMALSVARRSHNPKVVSSILLAAFSPRDTRYLIARIEIFATDTREE